MPNTQPDSCFGSHVPNLRGYSLEAAIRLAMACSNKSDDEIAAEMGWSSSVANRIICNRDYWPSLPTLPRLCSVLGNTVIARWIMDNVEFPLDQSNPMDVEALLEDLGKMFKEMADLAQEGHAALIDGQVSGPEARRLAHSLDDVFTVGAAMLARLQANINRAKKG